MGVRGFVLGITEEEKSISNFTLCILYVMLVHE